MTRRARSSLVLIALTLLGGCGYSTIGGDPPDGYQWRSLYREDIRTVAVPVFRNVDFRRGFELELSRALVQQIEQRTPYKVTHRQRADTILEGAVRSIDAGPVSLDSTTALPQEQLYIVRVDFTWKDVRSGRVLVDRQNFEQAVTYFPTLGEGQFVADQTAAEKLALAIVQEMEADW